MKRRTLIIAGVAGAALGVLVLVKTANSVYFAPRQTLQGEINANQTRLDAWRAALDKAPVVAQQLKAYANRTLGADGQSIDHMLRSRLNQIAQTVGLDGSTVGTGRRLARPSPARSLFSTRSAASKELHDRTDFVEVEAWISGEGTLAQAIELIDRIEAEPWIKKLTSVDLDPKDNGRRVAVNVRLNTLYLPGRAPDASHLDLYSYDRSSLDRLAGLVELNPFRVPPPKPVEPPPVVVVKRDDPPRPPPFPSGQWNLTGVAENLTGPEVWLRHAGSGETRRLSPGEGLHEAVFVAARGDFAEFEQEGNRFVIALGDPMDKRSPIR